MVLTTRSKVSVYVLSEAIDANETLTVRQGLMDHVINSASFTGTLLKSPQSHCFALQYKRDSVRPGLESPLRLGLREALDLRRLWDEVIL